MATKLTFKPVYGNSNTDWLQYNIPGDNTWHDVTFNLIAHGGSPLNMIYMYLDGGSTALSSGIVCFENLKIGDTEQSARVMDLIAVAVDAHQVDLTWSCNFPESVDFYNIYRGDHTGFTCDASTFLAMTPETVYADANLAVDQTYYYRVSIVDTSGQELSPSPEVSAHTYPSGARRLFEAEHATYTGLSLVNEPSASNGQYLQMSDTASVQWAFTLHQGGWYQIRFGYINTGSDCSAQLIKKGDNWNIAFGWCRACSEHVRLVALTAGINTGPLNISATSHRTGACPWKSPDWRGRAR